MPVLLLRTSEATCRVAYCSNSAAALLIGSDCTSNTHGRTATLLTTPTMTPTTTTTTTDVTSLAAPWQADAWWRHTYNNDNNTTAATAAAADVTAVPRAVSYSVLLHASSPADDDAMRHRVVVVQRHALYDEAAVAEAVTRARASAAGAVLLDNDSSNNNDDDVAQMTRTTTATSHVPLPVVTWADVVRLALRLARRTPPATIATNTTAAVTTVNNNNNNSENEDCNEAAASQTAHDADAVIATYTVDELATYACSDVRLVDWHAYTARHEQHERRQQQQRQQQQQPHENNKQQQDDKDEQLFATPALTTPRERALLLRTDVDVFFTHYSTSTLVLYIAEATHTTRGDSVPVCATTCNKPTHNSRRCHCRCAIAALDDQSQHDAASGAPTPRAPRKQRRDAVSHRDDCRDDEDDVNSGDVGTDGAATTAEAAATASTARCLLPMLDAAQETYKTRHEQQQRQRRGQVQQRQQQGQRCTHTTCPACCCIRGNDSVRRGQGGTGAVAWSARALARQLRGWRVRYAQLQRHLDACNAQATTATRSSEGDVLRATLRVLAAALHAATCTRERPAHSDKCDSNAAGEVCGVWTLTLLEHTCATLIAYVATTTQANDGDAAAASCCSVRSGVHALRQCVSLAAQLARVTATLLSVVAAHDCSDESSSSHDDDDDDDDAHAVAHVLLTVLLCALRLRALRHLVVVVAHTAAAAAVVVMRDDAHEDDDDDDGRSAWHDALVQAALQTAHTLQAALRYRGNDADNNNNSDNDEDGGARRRRWAVAIAALTPSLLLCVLCLLELAASLTSSHVCAVRVALVAAALSVYSRWLRAQSTLRADVPPTLPRCLRAALDALAAAVTSTAAAANDTDTTAEAARRTLCARVHALQQRAAHLCRTVSAAAATTTTVAATAFECTPLPQHGDDDNSSRRRVDALPSRQPRCASPCGCHDDKANDDCSRGGGGGGSGVLLSLLYDLRYTIEHVSSADVLDALYAHDVQQCSRLHVLYARRTHV